MTRKTRGAVVAIASIAMIVAAAGAAFGFTDDANAGGTTFVTAANALQKAGCAAGFGDGSFGYSATVTRGQDAIFQIACAPGIAYTQNSATPATTVTLGAAAATAQSVTFTAGINPGGLQYILVRSAGVLTAGAGNAVTQTISVNPGAGGTAVSPASRPCTTVTAGAAATGTAYCEAGFIVPTGQTLTITSSVSGTGTFTPGSLAVNSAPRGNSVPPAPGNGTLS